jgi:magnesium chelatase family protein
VERARLLQAERFAGSPGLFANAHMRPRELRLYCRVSEAGDALLRTAISRLGFSARAYHRVLKIARTIADLEGAPEVGTPHVAEAVQYRSLDRLRVG